MASTDLESVEAVDYSITQLIEHLQYYKHSSDYPKVISLLEKREQRIREEKELLQHNNTSLVKELRGMQDELQKFTNIVENERKKYQDLLYEKSVFKKRLEEMTKVAEEFRMRRLVELEEHVAKCQTMIDLLKEDESETSEESSPAPTAD